LLKPSASRGRDALRFGYGLNLASYGFRHVRTASKPCDEVKSIRLLFWITFL